MAARTTPQAVQDLLAGEYDGKTRLTPSIDTANVMVNWLATQDLAAEGLLNSGQLELIERWLSAHYYQMADPGYQNRSTGGASGGFQGQFTTGFKMTRFGQTALVIDVTNLLAKRDKEAEEGSRRVTQVYAGGFDAGYARSLAEIDANEAGDY